jgi:hypothetical protein
MGSIEIPKAGSRNGVRPRAPSRNTGARASDRPWREFIRDCARSSEGLLPAADLQAKYAITNEVWRQLAESRALLEAVRIQMMLPLCRAGSQSHSEVTLVALRCRPSSQRGRAIVDDNRISQWSAPLSWTVSCGGFNSLPDGNPRTVLGLGRTSPRQDSSKRCRGQRRRRRQRR